MDRHRCSSRVRAPRRASAAYARVYSRRVRCVDGGSGGVCGKEEVDSP